MITRIIVLKKLLQESGCLVSQWKELFPQSESLALLQTTIRKQEVLKREQAMGD